MTSALSRRIRAAKALPLLPGSRRAFAGKCRIFFVNGLLFFSSFARGGDKKCRDLRARYGRIAYFCARESLALEQQ